MATAAVAHAGPITLNTALPVADDQVFLKETIVWQRFSRRAGGRERRLYRVTATTILGYGVTPRLAAFLAIPVRYSVLRDDETPMGRATQRATGLGDLSLTGRFTVYRRDRPGKTFRIAPFAGLRVPSGANELRDSSGPLPPGLQPGSGGWAPIVGAVATYQTLVYQIDAQALYLRTFPDDGFDTGDILRFDISFQYRLLAHDLHGRDPAFLYGVTELGYRRSARLRFNDAPLTDEGRENLALTLGLQYVRIRWLAEVAVQIPLADNPPAEGLKSDLAVRVGFRINF